MNASTAVATVASITIKTLDSSDPRWDFVDRVTAAPPVRRRTDRTAVLFGRNLNGLYLRSYVG